MSAFLLGSKVNENLSFLTGFKVELGFLGVEFGFGGIEEFFFGAGK